jgi:hypothetical protein
VEEFVACSMHPLAASVRFKRIETFVTLVLKLRVPLPRLVAIHKDDEDNVQFLARVELEAECIVGSYTRPEHDACIGNLHNGGHLNWVFELTEVVYGPRLEPGIEEFTEASKKRKINAAGKNPGKHAKVLMKKKWESVKAVVPQGKTAT